MRGALKLSLDRLAWKPRLVPPGPDGTDGQEQDSEYPLSPFKGAARWYRARMTQSLVRPRDGKVIAGVCAALADRFGLSRSLVRIGFVLFGLFGVGELVYIVLWIVIPRANY